jgi:hypothetical protein
MGIWEGCPLMRLRSFPAELRTTRRKNDEEDQLQIALVGHLERRSHKDIIWYMVGNGTAKSKAVAGKAKAMGQRRGVGDMAFVLKGGQAAFLELKVGKNVASADQEEFAQRCEKIGALYAIVWGIDQALAVLEVWQVLKPDRLARNLK